MTQSLGKYNIRLIVLTYLIDTRKIMFRNSFLDSRG